MTAKPIHNEVRVIAWLALVLLFATPASGQVTFKLLDVPDHGRWADFSLSGDGTQMGCLLGGAVYWWSVADGFRYLDAGSSTLGGVGMSAGGNAMVAGRMTPSGPVPAIWYQDGSSATIGSTVPVDGARPHVDSGYDLSGDGTVVVGKGTAGLNERGFVWSRRGGVHWLSDANQDESRATAVSADGKTVVGFCEHPTAGFRRPVVWRDENEPEFFLGNERAGEALNISSDGRLVVGQAEMGGLSPQAFVWVIGQDPVSLGNLSGQAADGSLASAVSNDGIVVGWSGDVLWGSEEAFVWTANTGMLALSELVATAGAKLPRGVRLTRALDVSDDGSTIVGVCRDKEWNQLYWRVNLDGFFELSSMASKPARAPVPPPVVMPDSQDVQQADMMNPFPFGKRRF